jgi:outer membrane protein assembly factor BamA
MQKHRNIYLTVVSIAVFVFLSLTTYSKDKLYLIPSNAEKYLYEIDEIRFEGNESFSKQELLRTISQTESSRSIPHTLIEFFFENIKYTYIPREVKRSFAIALNTMKDELSFFDEVKAEEDVVNLSKFYYQKGFHDIIVDYSFNADIEQEKNILKFQINENNRYKISSIKYFGLDALEESIKTKISEKMLVKAGDYFDENLLMSEVSAIQRTLLNIGFFYSYYKTPVITLDTNDHTDSISVFFSHGKRQKISHINFIDSTHGQKIIAFEMKEKQLDIKGGQWYSKDNVDKTINNMLGLGTFDMVTVDTSSTFHQKTDSTLPIVVFANYRKQQEYGFSSFLNQTAIDNLMNVGVELSYFHRNIGGLAQVFNPFVRGVLQTESITDWKESEFEFQVGINFAQPLLWTIDKARIGVSSQLLYSRRTIESTLLLETFTMPVKFPIQLPGWTYFNYMSVDFTFERQAPINFIEAVEEGFRNSKNYQDSLYILKSFYQYDQLDTYVSGKDFWWLTAAILGVSTNGDTRDNPFAPSRGYFTAMTVEGTPFAAFDIDRLGGIAKFVRLQFTHYWFTSLGRKDVFATKFRAGHIFWWDKTNSYVPYDKQFFCGGANSVRGWLSRKLRYDNKAYADEDQQILDDYSDLFGSSSLLEGSIELRHKFSRVKALGSALGNQMENLGITAFIDIGNAFQWLVVDDDGEYFVKYNLWDYIKGLAVASGLGLRYDTPIGPVRIDFAWKVYNPMLDKDQTIFTRPNALSDFEFHIGLGHAF